MILPIDEINKQSKRYKDRAIPYDEYFDIMMLTEEQKKERIAFAEAMEDEILFIYALIWALDDYSIDDKDFIVEHLKQSYLGVVMSFEVTVDDYVSDIADKFANDFLDAIKKHPNDEWYTSEDRAKFNAENEANTVINYKDYVNALETKTTKTWHTENDDRVRPTHYSLEGETIGIDDMFAVGESLMRFPKDYEYASDYPEEIVNCRCSITYN